jgi:uncharacterized protein YdhG (YjbR/CyaY superfamily)
VELYCTFINFKQHNLINKTVWRFLLLNKPTKSTDSKTGKSVHRKNKVDGETAVLEKIDAMPEPYQTMGKKIHNIIKIAAPELSPRTWYGMPAYSKEGEVVCFFRSGDKFKERYMTLGFNEAAKLDEGNMWPVAFALTKLTSKEEEKIADLIKKAVK